MHICMCTYMNMYVHAFKICAFILFINFDNKFAIYLFYFCLLFQHSKAVQKASSKMNITSPGKLTEESEESGERRAESVRIKLNSS